MPSCLILPNWLILSLCFFFFLWALIDHSGQAKVLTESGEMREAQVDVPLSVIHSYF
jgi:Flp pilus assembly protein protease CpaA